MKAASATAQRLSSVSIGESTAATASKGASAAATVAATALDRDFRYRLARKNVHIAFANLAQAFQRMMLEPKAQQRYVAELNDLLVQSHVLASQITAAAPLLQSLNEADGQPFEPVQRTFGIVRDNLADAAGRTARGAEARCAARTSGRAQGTAARSRRDGRRCRARANAARRCASRSEAARASMQADADGVIAHRQGRGADSPAGVNAAVGSTATRRSPARPDARRSRRTAARFARSNSRFSRIALKRIVPITSSTTTTMNTLTARVGFFSAYRPGGAVAGVVGHGKRFVATFRE